MQQRPLSPDNGDSIPLEKQPTCTAHLYQQYACALFAYIKRHTATLNDAEDILTEVFIGTLLQDLPKMSADEQRAWLWTVTRNKVNDNYRQRHRRQQVSQATLQERPGNNDPEAQTIQQEEAVILHRYVQRLSAEKQEILQLRFVGELRCAAIAALLNKREGTIRSMLSRTLNELRTYYHC